MKYTKLLFIFLFIVFEFISCNKRNSTEPPQVVPDSTRINVPVFGQDKTFELVSWNIENFPKNNDKTVRGVVEIIRDLKADLFACEEIADTTKFRALIDSLPDYDGIYSADTYGSSYQKTAIIYNTGVVEIIGHQQILTNDSYSFPRPPLEVHVKATHNNKTFDFYLIVIHLKCCSGSDNEARRKSAIIKLKNYLDNQISSGTEKDYIISGDWNDVLTDPSETNVFKPFTDAPQEYEFLTKTLAQNPASNATYIGGSYRSVIDHILISADVLPEYNNGETRVLKIESYYGAYQSEVSDHRPVGAIFNVF